MLQLDHVFRTYRALTRPNRKAGTILFAETVSLGILSLPSVIATVGIAPGIALIVVMAILSGYSGLIFGEFCMQYPEIESFGDVGDVVGRAVGGPAVGVAFREFLGWGQTVFQIFVMGSHLLTWTISMNTCEYCAEAVPTSPGGGMEQTATPEGCSSSTSSVVFQWLTLMSQ